MASKWRASLQLYLWNCIGKQSVPGSGAGATASFIPTCALCHMRQPEAGIEAVAFMPFARRDLLSSHNRKQRRVDAMFRRERRRMGREERGASDVARLPERGEDLDLRAVRD